MADAILKTCTLCGSEKPHTEFYKHTGARLRAECKHCTTDRCSAYVDRNRASILEYKKRWHEQNASKYKEAKRARYRNKAEEVKRKAEEFKKANPERVKGYKKKWKQNNPESIREYAFVRNRTQRIAKPAWANRAAMVSIYKKARLLTKDTGTPHHVDHIVPLRSDAVCGLHCEQNMQILEASANQSKRNFWWPDMW